jgi:hypothetical protein
MPRYVEGKLQAAPDSQFVKGTAQVILDHLFSGSHAPGNIAIGQALPNQLRDVGFPACQWVPRGHDFICSF